LLPTKGEQKINYTPVGGQITKKGMVCQGEYWGTFQKSKKSSF